MTTRQRIPAEDKIAGVVIGAGCLYALIAAAIWIAVIVVAVHFIVKYW